MLRSPHYQEIGPQGEMIGTLDPLNDPWQIGDTTPVRSYEYEQQYDVRSHQSPLQGQTSEKMITLRNDVKPHGYHPWSSSTTRSKLPPSSCPTPERSTSNQANSQRRRTTMGSKIHNGLSRGSVMDKIKSRFKSFWHPKGLPSDSSKSKICNPRLRRQKSH